MSSCYEDELAELIDDADDLEASYVVLLARMDQVVEPAREKLRERILYRDQLEERRRAARLWGDRLRARARG